MIEREEKIEEQERDEGDPEAEVDEPAVAATAQGAEEESEEETLEARAERLEAELAESRDRHLRAAAELENFRKRTIKIRAETRDDTLRDVLLQVAPLLDNMWRALGQEQSDVESLRRGVELIVKQFNDILKGFGLEEIETEAQPFDPNLHEAVLQVESDDYPPGTVMSEMERGYTLRDRVVRAARVIVSKEREASSVEGEGDEGDGESERESDS
ncbi:MAG: nucleotide exchange factor GrpE [Candidatus Latescibacterota bacterium]|nr:nucleotide exchange factor GrpE [Candidatus Latescibacterota bacterium]